MAIRKGKEDMASTLFTYLEVTSLLLILASVAHFLSEPGLKNFLFYLSIFLPAMTANGSAVLAPRIKGYFVGRNAALHPIDGGRTWRGKRILGDGKTWEGFLVGSLAGIVIGSVIALLHTLSGGFEKGVLIFTASTYSSIAALIGDMLGSFIKRRIGLERGAPAPLLDQGDFYILAALTVYWVGIDLSALLVAWFFLFIYGMHILTNCIAYSMGLKNECP